MQVRIQLISIVCSIVTLPLLIAGSYWILIRQWDFAGLGYLVIANASYLLVVTFYHGCLDRRVIWTESTVTTYLFAIQMELTLSRRLKIGSGVVNVLLFGRRSTGRPVGHTRCHGGIELAVDKVKSAARQL